MKSYTEMLGFGTYQERLEYLSLKGVIGDLTFGSSRYLNQDLYRSREWRKFRDSIILRDQCCDLGCEDREILTIFDKETEKRKNVYTVVVHHINPLTIEDIRDNPNKIFDPNNVITCTDVTHRAIHYGVELPVTDLIERKPNDTAPWRK